MKIVKDNNDPSGWMNDGSTREIMAIILIYPIDSLDLKASKVDARFEVVARTT
jgi:hypothetical protein